MHGQKVENAFQIIIKKYTENDIRERIDEAIPDFLNNGWEEEFDDEYEAYLETGRGEAEAQVVQELLNDDDLHKINLNSDDRYVLYDLLFEYYDLPRE